MESQRRTGRNQSLCLHFGHGQTGVHILTPLPQFLPCISINHIQHYDFLKCCSGGNVFSLQRLLTPCPHSSSISPLSQPPNLSFCAGVESVLGFMKAGSEGGVSPLGRKSTPLHTQLQLRQRAEQYVRTITDAPLVATNTSLRRTASPASVAGTEPYHITRG